MHNKIYVNASKTLQERMLAMENNIKPIFILIFDMIKSTVKIIRTASEKRKEDNRKERNNKEEKD